MYTPSVGLYPMHTELRLATFIFFSLFMEIWLTISNFIVLITKKKCQFKTKMQIETETAFFMQAKISLRSLSYLY